MFSVGWYNFPELYQLCTCHAKSLYENKNQKVLVIKFVHLAKCNISRIKQNFITLNTWKIPCTCALTLLPPRFPRYNEEIEITIQKEKGGIGKNKSWIGFSYLNSDLELISFLLYQPPVYGKYVKVTPNYKVYLYAPIFYPPTFSSFPPDFLRHTSLFLRIAFLYSSLFHFMLMHSPTNSSHTTLFPFLFILPFFIMKYTQTM